MATTAYTATQTDPTNNLTNQTITPGAGVDRYNIAKQQFSNYADSTNPAYQASIRDATAAAAGAGQLGSGQLRTSYGNLANQRNQQLQNAQNSFLTDALNGSIQDAYNNIGIAQQQQGFQSGQQQNAYNQALATGQFNNATQQQQFNQALQGGQFQNDTQNQAFNQALATGNFQNATQSQQFNQGITQSQLAAALQNQQFNQGLQAGQFQNATQNQLFNQGITQSQLAAMLQGQQFNQGVTQSQLQDQLTNSAANRSAQQFALGSTGNPSDLQLALSQLYGNQASQAGNALSGLIGNTVANNTQQSNSNVLNQILAQLMGGGGTSVNPMYQIPQDYPDDEYGVAP